MLLLWSACAATPADGLCAPAALEADAARRNEALAKLGLLPAMAVTHQLSAEQAIEERGVALAVGQPVVAGPNANWVPPEQSGAPVDVALPGHRGVVQCFVDARAGDFAYTAVVVRWDAGPWVERVSAIDAMRQGAPYSAEELARAKEALGDPSVPAVPGFEVPPRQSFDLPSFETHLAAEYLAPSPR